MPKKPEKLADPRVWIKDLDIESTEDIAVPKMLVDQRGITRCLGLSQSRG